MRSSTKAIGCLLATSLALVLTACGITITAVHLPDEVQVNVGATAETAATYESKQEADSAAQQAAADKIDWTWEIGDDSIASVDANGVITGIKGGNTIVTLTSADGKFSAKCPVTVNQPLKAIKMDDIALETNGHTSETVAYTLEPADTTEDDVTLSVADESIAKLEGNKLVAVSDGTTKITATSGIVKTSAKVTVTTKVEQIVLNKTEGVLTVGNSVTVTATVTPDNATNATVNWTSSDEKVATVDSNGKVTAVAAGNATIKATSESDGDVSADYALTVNKAAAKPATRYSGTTSSAGAATTPSYTAPSAPSASTPTYVPEPAPAPAPAPNPAPAEPSQPSGGDSGSSNDPLGGLNPNDYWVSPDQTDWTQDNSCGTDDVAGEW
jgi:uncharacterized protein YjdB